jgi:hypothetical protein
MQKKVQITSFSFKEFFIFLQEVLFQVEFFNQLSTRLIFHSHGSHITLEAIK